MTLDLGTATRAVWFAPGGRLTAAAARSDEYLTELLDCEVALLAAAGARGTAARLAAEDPGCAVEVCPGYLIEPPEDTTVERPAASRGTAARTFAGRLD